MGVLYQELDCIGLLFRQHTGQPDGERPRCALHHRVRQHGPFPDRVHDPGPAGDDAADSEADAADAGHDWASTSDERAPDPLRQRPAEAFPGDYEPLPRGGGESPGLPGTDGGPAAHMDRAVPGPSKEPGHQPRRPGWALPASVLVEPCGGHRPTPELHLLRPGPGEPGPDADPPHPGGSFNLGPAEDDDDAHGGRQAAVYQQHDAVDDALDARLLRLHLPQRPGALLGDLRRHRRRDAGVHHEGLEPGHPRFLETQARPRTAPPCSSRGGSRTKGVGE